MLQRLIDSQNLRLEQAPRREACYRRLRLGRVRYALAGQNMALAQLAPQPADSVALRIGKWGVGTEPVHLVMSRKRADSAERLRAFNAAVRKLRANGELQTLEALEAQHVPRPPTSLKP